MSRLIALKPIYIGLLDAKGEIRMAGRRKIETWEWVEEDGVFTAPVKTFSCKLGIWKITRMGLSDSAVDGFYLLLPQKALVRAGQSFDYTLSFTTKLEVA